MAVVYSARDERLGRQVALKFLSPYLSADPDATSRFVAEARAAAALDHPNVCTIYEIGETEDGQLFIAMPLYDGETLQARLQRGRFTFERPSRLRCRSPADSSTPTGRGSSIATSSPPTSSILPDGTAKIVDFGIALIHDASARRSADVDRHGLLYESGAGRAVARSTVAPTSGRSGLSFTKCWRARGRSRVMTARRCCRRSWNADPQLTATSYPDVPARNRSSPAAGARESPGRALCLDVADGGGVVGPGGGRGQRSRARQVRDVRRGCRRPNVAAPQCWSPSCRTTRRWSTR